MIDCKAIYLLLKYVLVYMFIGPIAGNRKNQVMACRISLDILRPPKIKGSVIFTCDIPELTLVCLLALVTCLAQYLW